MPKPLQSLTLVLALLLLDACSTPQTRVERTLYSRHPRTVTQMSTTPAEGELPAGVWKIKGAQNTVYLGGTSHMVALDQIPFPSPFYAAYNDSAELYIEFRTDSRLSTVRIAPKAVRWAFSHRREFFDPEQSLPKSLSAEIVARLEEKYGKEFPRMKKWTPLFLLFNHEFEALGEDQPVVTGVEDFFTYAAHKDHKSIRALDDKKVIDTVFVAFDEMLASYRAEIAEKGADTVIREHVLEAKAEDPQDTMWRRGDADAVKKMQDEMKAESPRFYDEGLVQRNLKWLPKIKEALQKKHNILILVGIGHLPGPDGLLKLLQESGFHPEQLYGPDRPSEPAIAK